ncbi:2-amino-4-hydroxy-6-hydroxymethyldihydropteridine diphosphokinase [Corynebacterium sp. 335C]
MRAVLSIGGNIGDTAALLGDVARDFAAETVARSALYATPPWGGVEQDDFLNAVIVADVDMEPMDLLRRCQGLEQAAERTREVRWGPRTLDVDVVTLIDGGRELRSADPVLTLPHPRAHLRAFVLVPWLDADPGAELGGRPVAELIAELDDGDVAAIRRTDLAWPEGI